MTGYAQNEETSAEILTSPSATDTADVTQNFPLQLVYGDQALSDDDAFVLLIFGDGFTESEQDKFFDESKKTAEYIMATSPYDEFKDVIKTIFLHNTA